MRRLLLAALLTSATACFHINYVTEKAPAPSPSDDSWHHGGIFGLAEFSDAVDVPKICPNGQARIESQQNFVNGLVRLITVGLYTPQEVSVTCAR